MIIVTGGAGFIGSAIIWGLNNKWNTSNILVVDDLKSGEKWKNIRGLKIKDLIGKDEFIKYIEKDNKTFKTPYALIHMGACSDTAEEDASYLMNNNLQYSKKLAKYCLYDNSITFLYASSASIYGNGEFGFSDDDAPNLNVTLNKYAYSKQLFDCWMKNLDFLPKNRYVGLRYFNIFGPNEYHKENMSSFILKSADHIINTTNPKINLFKSKDERFADGEQSRDFLYIKDAVDMTLHTLENTPVRAVRGIVNIGSGISTTWKELANMILKSFDKRVDIRYSPDSCIDYIDMPMKKEVYQNYTKADLKTLKYYKYNKEITPISDAVYEYINKYIIPNKYLGDYHE